MGLQIKHNSKQSSRNQNNWNSKISQESLNKHYHRHLKNCRFQDMQGGFLIRVIKYKFTAVHIHVEMEILTITY